MATSAEVRKSLVDILELDLVGPGPGHPHESEILGTAPSRWYLAGFLIPYEPKDAKKKRQREERQENDEMDLLHAGGGDDEATPERASGRRAPFPSSMGVSVLVDAKTDTLSVTVQWGEYTLSEGTGEGSGQEKGGTSLRKRGQWKRKQRSEDVTVPVAKTTSKPNWVKVDGSDGLKLAVSVRPVSGIGPDSEALIPKGARSVSVFLVNQRDPRPDDREDEGMIFQATLVVRAKPPFVARPNLRGLLLEHPDERLLDLQYSDTGEFAVGHGVSTRAVRTGDTCSEVRTTWLPTAAVEKVEPATLDVELSMEALASFPSFEEAEKRLAALPKLYEAWIAVQKIPAQKERAEVARELLLRAGNAKERIAAGIQTLRDPLCFEAFKIANRTMAAAGRQRTGREQQLPPEKVAVPKWRPFQLAFLLLNLRGIAEPTHEDRKVVDLLFFPTGGGKTEAYLGLSAFTLVLRRLRNPGVSSAGVSILMRYTLRLLTLDQLARAAALICALELERKKNEKLGSWPFEIGLWVGLAATPNEMGRKGDRKDYTARMRTIHFQNDSKRNPSPIPLEDCPWCGTRFATTSFSLRPNPDKPTDLRIVCASRTCPFVRDTPLPIVAVDEPIYRRLPCFIIATVDKFASLPWVGPSGALLGRVDRYVDKDGFYGPCHPNIGRKLEKPLLPPDLIIQDELHLISGPLGTIAGLYEAAIEELITRKIDGQEVPPKIVASTATVRSADVQIRALFGRTGVAVFPPPGPNRRDSFFARTVPVTEKNPRLYVGFAAQGRSLKVLLLRSYLALLGASQKAWGDGGGDKNLKNPADPYMTLLGYFNSLRELGGSRRIVEGEVNHRLADYGKRRRVGEAAGPFADRKIDYEVVELTSREKTNKVAEARRRLAIPFQQKDRVDVALATNMISVGLDITRLGLMVILGQPKTTAEYIQASSRVGRSDDKPGLVLTLLNIHRPRDRSHYERFEAYHDSFYRSVEATSVTPFSPRAVDRALAAITVALARHGHPALTPPRGAEEIVNHRAELGFVAEALMRRAERHDGRLTADEANELRQKLKDRVNDLLDKWDKVAGQRRNVGAGLQYQREEGQAPPLLFAPLDPELARQTPEGRAFKANRSMREVELSVNLWVNRLDNVALPQEEA